MCGIAGIVYRGGSATKSMPKWKGEQLVKTMLTRIQHRGRELPLTSGSDNMWIGCCRLPIVDRDQGQQPVISEDGRILAVFNGEIYNHKALKEFCESRSHIISTDCDSEVIPHIFEENRDDPARMHDLFCGMYAIALVENKTGRCVLLRDHIGKKPLYLLETAEMVVFASEIKAFGVPFDDQVFGRSATVSELVPGETVVIEYGKVFRIAPQTRWKKIGVDPEIDFTTAVGSVRKYLTEAVRRRIPTDLPVAILCSGGIDSVIIAYLAKQCSEKVVAYVVGMENSPDVRAATIACHSLDIPLKRVIITEEAMPALVCEVVFHTESFEPNVVRNSLLAYLVFKQIKADDFRVALCGEGADELFHGYADFEDSPCKEDLMHALLDDLYRTQLLRVDRISMAFNVETRAPFLDRDVIELACRIPSVFKHGSIYGAWQGKAVLRQAFRDVLPWEIVTRDKATFSHGAGFGNVSMDQQGPVEQYAKRVLGSEKGRLKKAYPDIDQSTDERALYLFFYEQFYRVPTGYVPPTVAKRELHPTRKHP